MSATDAAGFLADTWVGVREKKATAPLDNARGRKAEPGLIEGAGKYEVTRALPEAPRRAQIEIVKEMPKLPAA